MTISGGTRRRQDAFVTMSRIQHVMSAESNRSGGNMDNGWEPATKKESAIILGVAVFFCSFWVIASIAWIWM